MAELPARDGLWTFPNPVNELSARLVAGGVVVMSVVCVVAHVPALLFVIAYGFIARVLTGPKLSPLGLFVTKAVVPRLPWKGRLVAGPPKRFAQGIGAMFSLTALVFAYGFRMPDVAEKVLGLLIVAATLESVFGVCLGCHLFRGLMRLGVIPESVCLECADVTERLRAATKAR